MLPMPFLAFLLLAAPGLLIAHSIAADRILRAVGLSIGLFIVLGTLYLAGTLPRASGPAERDQLVTVGFWFSVVACGILLTPIWVSRMLRAHRAAIYGSALVGSIAATYAIPPALLVLVCYARIEC